MIGAIRVFVDRNNKHIRIAKINNPISKCGIAKIIEEIINPVLRPHLAARRLNRMPRKKISSTTGATISVVEWSRSWSKSGK
jgi:hypothetical protein